MAIYGGQVKTAPYQAPDYGPSVAAARELAMTGAQGIAGMVGQVGDYFKQQGEKKKLIKKSDVQIDAALKLFPDLAPALQGYRDQLKDENLPLDDRMAIADSISKVIDLGIGEMRNAQKTLMERQRLGMEAEYKQGMLEASQMRAGASVLNAQAAAQPNYTFQEYNVKNPVTGEDEKSKLPVNPKSGRPRDIEANRDILNVQDWYENKGGLAPEEPAMPTPTSQVMPSDGKFGFTYKTRDFLPASTPNARQISLDFNAAANKNAKGIEIIIPNNASDIERALALDYVNKTKDFFSSKGVDVPVRGVRTAAENKRGSSNRFHTEPFFVNDAASRAAIESDPDGYAQVLASTIGKIPGAMFIPPHKSNDPGASANGINERDFAKGVLIPALERLSTQGVVTAMGTPQQQAEVARMIEEGQGMAMAQNMPQGAMPTDPSMAIQQPQLPQQAAPKVNLRPGFAPVRSQGNKPTTKMTAEQVANLAAQGFKVNALPTDDGNFIVSSATVGGGSETTFGFDPKTGRVTVTQGGSKVGQAAKAEEKAKLTATGLTQDLFELKRRYSNLSAGTGPIPALSRLGASAVYGTPAYGVKEIANRVTDGLTIENIMSARRSNASGAALGGSTSDKDMQIYKNSTTSINAAQNPEEFNREWTRLMEAQLNIVYGTSEQRANLVKENKITEEYNKQIEDLYPDETINMKGQLVPRVKTTTPNVKSPITSETQAILDRYGKGQ